MLVFLFLLSIGSVDAVDYDATIRVFESDHRIEGTVLMRVDVPRGVPFVSLDAENLAIASVEEIEPVARLLRFNVRANKLWIDLSEPTVGRLALRIRYSAVPKRGMRFTAGEVFTYFHTLAWLPCIFDPADRATLTMHLEVRPGEETL